MDDVRLEYSQLRDTWNVFVNGEWYFEGNYEQACNVADSFYFDDGEEYYGDNGDEGYEPWREECEQYED